jgi:WD40 repeat protein
MAASSPAADPASMAVTTPTIPAVSPDGGRLATSGNDGRVKVWDAASGEELHVLYTPGRSFPNEVAFSPDGRRLASSEQFGNVRVWALDIDQLVELARSRLTRGLTDQECRQYLHMAACPPSD